MSDELPRGWILSPLRPIVRTRSGDSKLIKGKLPKVPAPSLFPAFSASGQDVWVSELTHEGRAIIVSAVGARCGKCFYANGRWSAIANTHVLWPDERVVDRDFLWWRVNDETFWKKGGSAQPFVKVGDTLAEPFSLPPLAEQRRIVARIEALFARTRTARAHLLRIAPLARHYRDQCRRRAFDADAGWVANGAVLPLADYEPPQRFEGLPSPPEGWRWAAISSLGSIAGGITKNQRRAARPIQIPYLRVANVYADELRLGAIEMIRVSESERDRVLLEPGDLLIVEGNGSVEQIGRVAVWNGAIAGCGHQNHLIRIRPRAGIPPRYLLHWLMSPYGRSILEAVASSSSGLHTLSLSKVSAIPVPVAPTETARTVAEALDGAMASSARAEHEATRALSRSSTSKNPGCPTIAFLPRRPASVNQPNGTRARGFPEVSSRVIRHALVVHARHPA